MRSDGEPGLSDVQRENDRLIPCPWGMFELQRNCGPRWRPNWLLRRLPPDEQHRLNQQNGYSRDDDWWQEDRNRDRERWALLQEPAT